MLWNNIEQRVIGIEIIKNIWFVSNKWNFSIFLVVFSPHCHICASSYCCKQKSVRIHSCIHTTFKTSRLICKGFMAAIGNTILKISHIHSEKLVLRWEQLAYEQSQGKQTWNLLSPVSSTIIHPSRVLDVSERIGRANCGAGICLTPKRTIAERNILPYFSFYKADLW